MESNCKVDEHLALGDMPLIAQSIILRAGRRARPARGGSG